MTHSINRHFHQTGAEYKVMELPVRQLYLKRAKHTSSIPSLHQHDHWIEPPPRPTLLLTIKYQKKYFLTIPSVDLPRTSHHHHPLKQSQKNAETLVHMCLQLCYKNHAWSPAWINHTPIIRSSMHPQLAIHWPPSGIFLIMVVVNHKMLCNMKCLYITTKWEHINLQTFVLNLEHHGILSRCWS
jgi:hypothetical protein